MKKQKLAASFRRLLVASVLCAAVGRAGADPYNGQNPPGCSASALAAVIDVVPSVAHVGDTVVFTMAVSNQAVAGACDQDAVQASYASPTDYPMGTTVNFGDIGTIPAVPVGDPAETVDLPPQNYTILAADLENIGGINFVIGLVRANGTVAGSTPSPSTASQTIAVTVFQPNIQITKTCRLIPNPLGGFLGEATVTLLNTGDVALRDLVVNDDAGTPGVPGDDFDPAVRAGGPAWPVTLGVGASTSRTYTFELTSSPYINTVTVTGNDGLPTSPGNEAAAEVEDSDTCRLVAPSITIDKQVACVSDTGACGAGLAYGETATGVKGLQDPAFCYRIVVTNNGGENLENVVLTDAVLGINQAIGNLAAGAEAGPFYFKKSWGVSTPNTATASGVGAESDVTVTDSDPANVIVVPAAISCSIILSNPFDMDGNDDTTGNDNHVTLDQSAPVIYELTITNNGQVPIGNLAIAGAPCEVIVEPGTVIPPGESITLPWCEFTVQCSGAVDITTTITGDVVASDRATCVYDANGEVIGVTTQCRALVECEVPKTCRTTGGGTLESQYADSPTENYAPYRYELRPDLKNGSGPISHGGQLGAPYANETCFTPNAKCIKGQWQHVRHLDGRGNPRENFHSNTFDSVKCACLDCEGESIDPVNGLCNPGDRVCGPEPRKAPANAIAFSGVGDFSVLNLPGGDKKNGRRAARSVVFRVYIQDRGEPGGYHPRKEGIDPPDVYCFQMWHLPDNSGDADSPQNLAFREAVAQAVCDVGGQAPDHHVTYTWDDETITVPADINDCGPLDRGNRQIHPSTSAVCEDEVDVDVQ